MSYLTMTLGEPDTMDFDAIPNKTIMQYKLRWKCGCRAEGSAENYLLQPCTKHADRTRVAG